MKSQSVIVLYANIGMVTHVFIILTRYRCVGDSLNPLLNFKDSIVQSLSHQITFPMYWVIKGNCKHCMMQTVWAFNYQNKSDFVAIAALHWLTLVHTVYHVLLGFKMTCDLMMWLCYIMLRGKSKKSNYEFSKGDQN